MDLGSTRHPAGEQAALAAPDRLLLHLLSRPVNVGFAALTMNKDLGISATAYGLGAGVFFLTYFAFEVPSNLFLERVGARV